MPESIHSANSQIPISIPEPAFLTWTVDYDDGDVAYISGPPPPPRPPPPSAASESNASLAVTIGHTLSTPPPPPPSLASKSNNRRHSDHRASAVSLAHATVGEGSNSRRVSMIEEENVNDGLEETNSPKDVETRVPAYPLEFIFSPVEGDPQSMVVTPSIDTVNSRPLYHIRATHDLFDPSFFVTSIRRGASDGPIVGDFTAKADCSALEETVYLNESEYHIFKRLVSGTKKDEFQWKLQHKNSGLLLWKWEKHWTCRHVPDQKKLKNKHYDILAQFYPPPLRTSSNSQKIARMTMQPAGQNYLDEILISLLILERKRRKIAR